MKVLVCGGRDFDDEGLLGSRLWHLRNENGLTHVIHGGANGADKLAGEWARSQYSVQEVICPANWYLHGKAAGPMRNRAMAEIGPDLVLAFKGGRGTENMVKTAEALGIQVERVT